MTDCVVYRSENQIKSKRPERTVGTVAFERRMMQARSGTNLADRAAYDVVSDPLQILMDLFPAAYGVWRMRGWDVT